MPTTPSQQGIRHVRQRFRHASPRSGSVDPAQYLPAVVGAEVPADRRAAFLAQGPPMTSFVTRNSPLRFRWMEGYHL